MSSVALTTFVYDAADFSPPAGASGFLVPRVEGRLMTACSYGSNKWPHWAAAGRTVIRVSAGRVGDERALSMSDSELVEALRHELTTCLGLTAEPVVAPVHRWVDGFPQLQPGHLQRMVSLRRSLAVDLPGVTVAGAWTGGVGIPTCIASGQAAAAAVLA
jgi:oxygen-dependent protoporphyrinogen oxidase